MADAPLILGQAAPFLSLLWRRNSASSMAIVCSSSDGTPAPLAANGIRSVTLEIDAGPVGTLTPSVGMISVPGTITGNRVLWSFSSALTAVTWNRRPARLVFWTDLDRFVVAEGEVRVSLRPVAGRNEFTATLPGTTVEAVVFAPAGADGAPAGVIRAIAAEALSGERVVTFNATGAARLADSATADDAVRPKLFTRGAASSGAYVELAANGSLPWPAAGLTAGQPLYLGPFGLLTTTPPSRAAGDAFAQVLATAQTPSSVWLNPQPPILF